MKTETATAAVPTVIPALGDCVLPAAGPVRLMYDSTLKRPLRLRDGQGVKLDPETHAQAARVVVGLDGLLQPLAIDYLRAEMGGRARTPGRPLDSDRLAWLPKLLIAYAAADGALEDVVLTLRPSLCIEPGTGTIDAALEVAADATVMTDPAVAARVQAYAAWSAQTWADCVQTVLGPWAIASGLRELQLSGSFRPSRADQLAVLSGAPAGAAPTLH